MKLKPLLTAGILLFASASHASVFTDDLSRCLVTKSNSKDSVVLARWMFSALSSHPSVSDLTTVNKAKQDSTNKAMATLLNEMLTKRCLKEARAAIKADGAVAIQKSFEVFGRAAGQTLFANPNVRQNIAGLATFIDSDKMAKELGLPK